MKTFNEIAEDLLKIEKGNVSDTLTPSDVPGWDSMNYLLFIAELESVYGFSFSMDEVLNAKTLGDIHDIVRARKSE